jgi:hypothetical protein
MPNRKMNSLLPIGMLMLAGGLILHNFTHARYSEFTGGFLIGMSLVFMIAGFVWRNRGIA